MSSYIVSRRPFDTHSFRTFHNLTYQYKDVLDQFYIWSATFNFYDNDAETNHLNFIKKNISNKNVIIGIKDHLSGNKFNPWFHTKPEYVYRLEEIFLEYSHLNFLVFSSLENLDYYLKAANLVGIIPWGGDIIDRHIFYKDIQPIIDKDLDSKFNFVSINQENRNHKFIHISLCYHLNLEDHGIITDSFKDTSICDSDYREWRIDKNLLEKINRGLLLSKQRNHISIQDYKKKKEIYYDLIYDNINDFQHSLTERYRQVFVEIVNESLLMEQCFNITDKTLNCIYGCNFPIFNSSIKTVDFLRNAGVDVFDDIVDHSYDLIENPVERIYRSIKDNEYLLKSPDIKDIWKMNRHRFLKNIEFVKYDLFRFYENRAKTQFNLCVNRLL